MQPLEERVDNTCIIPTKFPLVLMLQMDNYASDKKNHYMLVYVSLLMEKRIFQLVEVGFLPVVHAYEYIDGTSIRLSI